MYGDRALRVIGQGSSSGWLTEDDPGQINTKVNFTKHDFLLCEDDHVNRMVKDIAVSAGGLGFGSLAGRIKHCVANCLPPLRCFFGALLIMR